MKALFKADGYALDLKCRQHNDIWKHAIRLQLFVENWGINMVPGHSEILALMINRGSLGHRERQEQAKDSWKMSLSFKGSVDLL